LKLWKPLTVALGIGAACAACCAIPGLGFLVAAMTTGTLVGGIGFGVYGWIAGILAIAAVSLFLLFRRRRAVACSVSSCGCRDAAAQDATSVP